MIFLLSEESSMKTKLRNECVGGSRKAMFALFMFSSRRSGGLREQQSHHQKAGGAGFG
jgi:hypothetical protein